LFLAYKDAGQFRRIIQYATEKLAAEALEQDPELLTTLGWAYLKAGRQEEGSQAYSQALAVTGKDFAEHTVVVSALAKTLGPQAALEWAQSVAKLDPSNVDTRRALVHLFKMNDKTDLAIAECDQIMEMTPGDANMVFAHLAKGMLLNSLDRAEEAKSQYEAALKIDPDQPVALNNLAYLLAKRLNKPAEALPYAKRASRVLPQDDNVLDTYGWVLSLNGKLGDAAGTLLRALEIKRDNLDATIHLGMVCLKQKDLEEARFRLNRAKELAEAQGRTDELPKIIKALKEVDDLGG
jgi:Flp pilus assembly protein TadD